LPIKVKFNYEYSTQKAIDAGVSIVLNGKIFLEGLTQAEDIAKAFKELL